MALTGCLAAHGKTLGIPTYDLRTALLASATEGHSGRRNLITILYHTCGRRKTMIYETYTSGGGTCNAKVIILACDTAIRSVIHCDVVCYHSR